MSLIPPPLRWQVQRLARLLRGGLRSLQARGPMQTLRHIPKRLGWGATALPPLPCSPDNRWVLVMDAQIPDPRRDSGSVRLLALCQLLQEDGLTIAFAPHSGTADNDERQRLHAAGIHLLGTHGGIALPRWLQAHHQRVQAVILCHHDVAAVHLPLVRQFAPGVPIAFDTVDLHYLREQRHAELLGDAAALAAAQRTRQAELALVASADITYVVSPVEADLLVQACPQARIAVLSNIHALQPPGGGPDTRSGVLFVGGWGHPPNRDALAWLTQDIWPRVRERMPALTLHLVGDLPDDERIRLSGLPGVIAHGRVDTLDTLMHHCRVSIAPLRAGAGVKGKVNSAMSYGLPVVLTPVAAEGMYIVDGQDALIGDTADALATAVIALHHDDVLWTQLAAAGRQNVATHFSTGAARAALHRLLALSPVVPDR